MKNVRAVEGSVAFRDAVLRLEKENLPSYVRMNGTEEPTYRVIAGLNKNITIDDLFNAPCPPVQMEELATALWRAERAGQKVSVVVFTL